MPKFLAYPLIGAFILSGNIALSDVQTKCTESHLRTIFADLLLNRGPSKSCVDSNGNMRIESDQIYFTEKKKDLAYRQAYLQNEQPISSKEDFKPNSLVSIEKRDLNTGERPIEVRTLNGFVTTNYKKAQR